MKKFTYSFLSILMLLLAMPLGALARTTVTFDFAANPWGLPLSSSTKGELDKGAITSPILQDGVSLTTTDGTNKTKMWVADGVIDLRIYKKGGTFTFTAPEGKVIEKIEFTGTVAATADAGTYDGSSKTWAQPKEQVNAVKFKATATTKLSKAVLTIADPGEGAEVVVLPEIADFASLKATEKGKAVKLTVTNGKVVYAGSRDLIVEDATGAIDFYNWGIKATAGQVINGVVEAKYDEFLGMPQAAKTANTDVAALTITDGEAVAPVAMEFADAMKATSYLKYVTLADFAIEKTDGKTYLVSGENKIQLYDKFRVEYTLPENIQSISGIIIPFVANGSTDVIVEIAPTCAEDIVAKPAAEILEVNNIAELRKLASDKEGAEIKLKLTDAQIKYADPYMSSIVLIEDATGAFNAQYFFAEALGMELLKDEYKLGSVLNGTLNCLYSYPGSIEVSEENTGKSNITVTDAPVVATEAQLAEVWNEKNNYRLYEFKDVTVNKNEADKFQLVQDGVKIEINDLNHQLSEDKMATVGSVTGYLRIVGEEAEFILVSYQEKATVTYTEVNSIAELRAIKVKEEYEEVPVKLNLHDAHISALNKAKDSGPELLSETDAEIEGGDAAEAEEVINFAILEDATGAIEISQLLQPGIDAGMISGKFELGTVLNGYLYAAFSYPNQLMFPEGSTEKSVFTTTPSTLVPTESTLAEIIKPENDLRLFTLKNVTIKNVATEVAPDYNICQGETSIMLSDGLFNVFGETMPEKVESITGILYGMFEEFGEAPASYMFVPTAAVTPTTPGTPETPAITVVDNIAALRKLEPSGEENQCVKLMLKNAKITYVQNTEGEVDPEYSVMYALLEDESGAVEISDLVAKAKLNNWFEGELKEGVALNGYVIVDYSSFFPRLVVNDETAKSEITITPTEITPTVVTIADVQKPENHLRMFELQNVELVKEDGSYAFKQDGNIIAAVDMFKNMLDKMPTNIESVTGVLFLDLESYCFVPTSYLDHPSPAPVEVNSIAELNKLGEENEGATIKLKLTDAQITVADASMSSAIIEDKTGAFNAMYFFAEAGEMLEGEFKQGIVLNGYLYATYSYGSIEVCDLTAESEIAVTEAPVVATEADFAEVLKAENNYRLYEFKNITVNKNELDHFQLVKGDAKAEISDRTRSLEESMMANVESVVGYFRIKGDEAEFTLISYKTATPDGISALEVAAKNAAVYNLNGAKVLGAGESVKGLAKGIYVVGGKKIVVK